MSSYEPPRVHHLRPLREVDTIDRERTQFIRHDSTGPTPLRDPDCTTDQSQSARRGGRLAEPGSYGALEDSYKRLTVEFTRDGDVWLILLSGELDASSAAVLDGAVHAAEASDAKQITIDLREVSFMDSAGLHVLLRASARSRANSNRLRLIGGPRRVQRVIELTNTERLLPFLD